MMIFEDTKIPRFINCKSGFVQAHYCERTGICTFLGFTKNLRTATAFYLPDAAICSIARKLVRKAKGNGDYFAIMEASQLNFSKQGEISND